MPIRQTRKRGGANTPKNKGNNVKGNNAKGNGANGNNAKGNNAKGNNTPDESNTPLPEPNKNHEQEYIKNNSLPEKWRKVQLKKHPNIVWYENEETNQRQWFPPGGNVIEPVELKDNNSLPSGWRVATHKNNDVDPKEEWYESDTEETSWNKPTNSAYRIKIPKNTNENGTPFANANVNANANANANAAPSGNTKAPTPNNTFSPILNGLTSVEEKLAALQAKLSGGRRRRRKTRKYRR